MRRTETDDSRPPQRCRLGRLGTGDGFRLDFFARRPSERGREDGERRQAVDHHEPVGGGRGQEVARPGGRGGRGGPRDRRPRAAKHRVALPRVEQVEHARGDRKQPAVLPFGESLCPTATASSGTRCGVGRRRNRPYRRRALVSRLSIRPTETAIIGCRIGPTSRRDSFPVHERPETASNGHVGATRWRVSVAETASSGRRCGWWRRSGSTRRRRRGRWTAAGATPRGSRTRSGFG